MKNRDKEIQSYIEHMAKRHNIQGVFICGSYVTGDYGKDSDLDIFFLVEDHNFEMILEVYEGVLFDRIFVDYKKIIKILESDSRIGEILSYSFGSNNKIIVDSEQIRCILSTAHSNIKKKNLIYIKNEEKPCKIVDGISFEIAEEENMLYLVKDGSIVI